MTRFVVLLPAFLALGACYRYVPLPTPQPEVGAEVRSFLTPEGTEAVATTLGRNVSVFDGRVLNEQGAAWRFAVTQTATREDRRVNWTGEPVDIPRSAIARMQLRVLDRPKTIRTAILAAVGGVAVGLMIRGIATSDGGSGGPGTNPNAIVIH